MNYNEITDKYKALNRLVEILTFSVEDFMGSAIAKSNHYALMIGKKILDHCISVLNLSNKQTYYFSNNTRIEFIDFPTIAVITRSIVESYLAFNHIFINSNSEEEAKFKWLVYDLAGYFERQSFKATIEEHIKIKEEEVKSIQILREQIKDNPFFTSFSEKQQKQLLQKENWKLFNSWGDLAVKAGYDSEAFNQTYKYLCSYVHSGRLSILQILDANKNGKEINLVNSNINTCCGALAKYICDIGKLIPEFKDFYEKEELDKKTIEIWVKVAERV